MTDAPANTGQATAAIAKLRGTGWGGKALLVFALALVMAIPGLFVFGLVAERSHRAESVIAEVSARNGGLQQILGPVLVAPLQYLDAKGAIKSTRWYVVSPREGAATATVKTETLHRGIFDVPVYEANVVLSADFGPVTKTLVLADGGRVDWTRAQIVLGFSDLRGAKSDVVGTFAQSTGKSDFSFVPASGINLGGSASGKAADDSSAPTMAAATGNLGDFGLVAAPAAAIADSASGGTFTTKLKLTGAERLSVAAFAKTTRVSIAGDWNAPSFDGAFLPEKRNVADAGFTALWNVPFLARGLSDMGAADTLSLTAMGAKDVGVTFARSNNPYENVTRSLKYGVMFIGLVFLTFFVFEALSGRRVHPAQYVLIGLAQMVFYLLLLSLSEYVGFDLGFLCAAVATVGLIGFYAGWAFDSAAYRLRALAIFSLIYVLIYVLMRLEDFALLVGSVTSFVGLALAMFLTRHIDWYGGRGSLETGAAPAAR